MGPGDALWWAMAAAAGGLSLCLAACSGPTREQFVAGAETSSSAFLVKDSYDVPRPFDAVMRDITARAPGCFNRMQVNAAAQSMSNTTFFIETKSPGSAQLSLKFNGIQFLLTADVTSKGPNTTHIRVFQSSVVSNGQAASIRAWAMGEDSMCKYGMLSLPF
jgi:hypothetical protein